MMSFFYFPADNVNMFHIEFFPRVEQEAGSTFSLNLAKHKN